MRQIFSQPAHGLSALRITAANPPFRGTASHAYYLEGFDTTANRAARSGGFVPRFRDLSIIFATEEPANDSQPDGVTIDSLLAVMADHLQGLCNGPTGSMTKSLALEYIESAREVLTQDQQMFERSHSYTPYVHAGGMGKL